MKNFDTKAMLIFGLTVACVASWGLLAANWDKLGSSQSLTQTEQKPAKAKSQKKYSLSAAIDSKTGALQVCYEKFLKGSPNNPEGEVGISWLVSQEGSVLEAEIVDSELDNPPLEDCLLEHVQKWTFAPMEYTMKVAHRFSFRERSPASIEFQ